MLANTFSDGVPKMGHLSGPPHTTRNAFCSDTKEMRRCTHTMRFSGLLRDAPLSMARVEMRANTIRWQVKQSLHHPPLFSGNIQLTVSSGSRKAGGDSGVLKHPLQTVAEEAAPMLPTPTIALWAPAQVRRFEAAPPLSLHNLFLSIGAGVDGDPPLSAGVLCGLRLLQNV